MSIVAIKSADGYSWSYAGAVANASGPGGYPNSTFGPDENDIAVLGDGKTILCVIRMDGDAGCSTNSYRNYAAIYSHDDGATCESTFACPHVDAWGCWVDVCHDARIGRDRSAGGRAVPIPGAGCARPRLLKLTGGPLVLSGGRLCVEHTDDISICERSWSPAPQSSLHAKIDKLLTYTKHAPVMYSCLQGSTKMGWQVLPRAAAQATGQSTRSATGTTRCGPDPPPDTLTAAATACCSIHRSITRRPLQPSHTHPSFLRDHGSLC
jgi:hypothetical protein